MWTLTRAVSGRLYLDRLLGPRPDIDEIVDLTGPFLALIGFALGTGALVSLIPGAMEDPLPGPPGEGPGAVTFMFFAIVLLGPVIEEVLFRGILLQRWSLRWGPVNNLLPAIVAVSSQGLVEGTAEVATEVERAASDSPGEVVAMVGVAAFLLTLSVPYLVRFIRERWPGPETVVPYYRQEGVATRVV